MGVPAQWPSAPTLPGTHPCPDPYPIPTLGPTPTPDGRQMAYLMVKSAVAIPDVVPHDTCDQLLAQV